MRSEKSIQLYNMMLNKGYPRDLCAVVSDALRTDFTAGQMLGYIARYPRLPDAEVADEMLAILSFRDSIVEYKRAEQAQHRINEVYRCGLTPNDEDE